MVMTENIANEIQNLQNAKGSIVKNYGDIKNNQRIGAKLLDLAEQNSDLGQEADEETSDYYIFSERRFDKYNGKRMVVEDDGVGNVGLITSDTLINVLNDIISDLKDDID